MFSFFETFCQQPGFETVIVTNSVALHPGILDVDRDGSKDIVVVDDYTDKDGNDGTNLKTICWFSQSGKKGGGGFRRNIISMMNFRSCGIDFADIDNDGYTDIIGRKDTDADDFNDTGNIFWLRNPFGSEKIAGEKWQEFNIGFSTYSKDIKVSDFNGDRKKDVMVRGVDGCIRVFIQVSPAKWTVFKISVPEHDGSDVADIDLDGDQDIVINGLWLEAPGDVESDVWIRHDFAPQWYTRKTGAEGEWFDNNTRVAVYDIDKDSYPDIFISCAEDSGYKICWYKNPGRPSRGSWQENIIGDMDFAHTLRIADMDNDGDMDVVTGSLSLYNDPDPDGYHPVAVFKNIGRGLEWEKQVISEQGCYGGTTGDIDNDGDVDIVAPRNWNRAPLYLWKNLILK